MEDIIVAGKTIRIEVIKRVVGIKGFVKIIEEGVNVRSVKEVVEGIVGVEFQIFQHGSGKVTN